MKTRPLWCMVVLLTLFGFAAHPASSETVQSEVPAGTRFLVELRDTLKAKKVKRGKKFEARTLEALPTADGRIIPAGTKLKGKVSYADNDELVLRFEEIDLGGQKQPIVASVLGVIGEKGVKSKAGKEGEIEAKGGRGKSAAIGAAAGGGIGTAVGATRKEDHKRTAIAAGSGAALGALIGAAAGGRDLVLDKGTRMQLQLDRPLWVTSKP